MNTKILLKSLNGHKVRFVIIGATAGVAHGFVRLTEDIDIFVEPTRENMEKALQALQACGYDVTDVTLEEALQKKLLFRGYLLKTDIHPSAKGVDWETLWTNKVQYRFHEEDIYFSSLDDLIKMKRAAGRSKDLEDLLHLEEIRRQTSAQKPSKKP